MVRVEVVRHRQGRVISFRMFGHAGYAEYGQDIVCAAVSAVSIGTINAIEQLLSVALEPDMDKKTGLISCTLPEQRDPRVEERMQLLIEGMLVALLSIEEQYGEHLNISTIVQS